MWSHQQNLMGKGLLSIVKRCIMHCLHSSHFQSKQLSVGKRDDFRWPIRNWVKSELGAHPHTKFQIAQIPIGITGFWQRNFVEQRCYGRLMAMHNKIRRPKQNLDLMNKVYCIILGILHKITMYIICQLKNPKWHDRSLSIEVTIDQYQNLFMPVTGTLTFPPPHLNQLFLISPAMHLQENQGKKINKKYTPSLHYKW